MHRILLLLACTGCFFALACSNTSSSGSGGDNDAAVDNDAGNGCVAYDSDASLTTPTVSFQTEVIPIFEHSCGVSGATCHGDPSSEKDGLQRPFLGEYDGGTDPAAVISAIVGVASNEDPKMDEVTAGEPTKSYLMHKMDGDQCTLAAGCATGSTPYTNCGQLMPQTTPIPLEQSTRDTIRRWIAQGATSK
jgi:hypothetical protein